eukprot:1176830-Prorocentrum_minimum.AAC.8
MPISLLTHVVRVPFQVKPVGIRLEPFPRLASSSSWSSGSPGRSRNLSMSTRVPTQNPAHAAPGERLLCRSQGSNQFSNADLSAMPDALYHEIVNAGMVWSDKFAQAEFMDEGITRNPI